ncbi:hypothetical protein [Wenxinia saemankumensis]|uniref:Uncharacterized protein n=1 Tax=Wenxinia saemankumensis TaxID=1447782 RepID=A0A1M6C0A5_9RHOB|nr:hypothetical protein [Wenxinia saemankumensis]SHI54301.1 hypothetical protein SAMN05444417_0934 [Wenxinia saemankumensis]
MRAAILVTSAVALWVAIAIGLQGTSAIAREGGAVELASALVLLAALLLWLARGGGSAAAILIAALAAREFDLDKAPFERGILGTGLYIGAAPFWQKAIGLAVIGLLVWALTRWAQAGMRPFVTALRRGRIWALLLAGGVALAALAKSLDGIARKVAPLGVDLGSRTVEIARLAEESLELVFALSVLWTVALVQRGWRRDGSAPA